MTGWVAPGFRQAAAQDEVPLHVRLEASQCGINPTEPEYAAECRVAAVTAAQLAVTYLRAGNLHRAEQALKLALAETVTARQVYDQDRSKT